MCQYERKQNDRSTGVSSNSALQPEFQEKHLAVDQSSNKLGLGQNQSKQLDNNYQILEMIKFAMSHFQWNSTPHEYFIGISIHGLKKISVNPH